MSELATAQPASVTAAPKPARERRISKRMQQALELLATRGMTQRDAAAKAGISEFHLSREMKKPQIQAFIARRCSENIQRGMFRASVRLAELVDADSEHVAANVSTRLLEHGGILRAQTGGHSVNVSINNSFSPGYVVNLGGEQQRQAPRTVDVQAVVCDDSKQDQ